MPVHARRSRRPLEAPRAIREVADSLRFVRDPDHKLTLQTELTVLSERGVDPLAIADVLLAAKVQQRFDAAKAEVRAEHRQRFGAAYRRLPDAIRRLASTAGEMTAALADTLFELRDDPAERRARQAHEAEAIEISLWAVLERHMGEGAFGSNGRPDLGLLRRPGGSQRPSLRWRADAERRLRALRVTKARIQSLLDCCEL